VSTSATALRALGVGRIRTREAFARMQLALVLAALGLNLTWVPLIRKPLPIPGSTAIFIPDVVLGLVVAQFVVLRAFGGSSAGVLPRTRLVGLPLALFALALVPGILRGHERYGASLVGQPLRLVLYAAVLLAMTKLRPRNAYRAIVALFYGGAVLQAAFACWYLATGTSQSNSDLLSTGGIRTLDVGTSIYLAGTLFLVVLNLDMGFPLRRWVHLTVGALALFGIVLAYDRTTFLALIVLLPFAVWRLARSSFMSRRRLRVWVPIAAVGTLAVALVTVNFAGTLIDRVTANPLQDHNVRWRVATVHRALAGLRSGDWRPQSPFDEARNELANPGFEAGREGWAIQGGRIMSVLSGDPSFGERSLEMVTAGATSDEGLFSAPVLTTPGQSWTFSIWLKGASGGERVNVSIWKYGRGGRALGQSNLPVTLTTVPRPFFVTTAATDPATTSIRALVRTQDRQKIVVTADDASLKTFGHDAIVKGLPYLAGGGGVTGAPIGKTTVRAADGSVLRLTKESNVANGGFERGTSGWLAQGGSLRVISSNNPRFGKSSLELTTAGTATGEGFSSGRIAVLPEQTWRLSVWLKGTRGAEAMTVSIRQYDARDALTKQTEAPVTLSFFPTEYFVTTTIARPATHVRAFVTTRSEPQSVVIYADDVQVRRFAPVTQAAGAHVSGANTAQARHFRIAEPLLGLGFGRSFDYIWEGTVYHFDGDPHNGFVWLLGGGGVFALGSFLLLLGVFVRTAWQRLRLATGYGQALVLWAVLTWFVFMLNVMTEPILSQPAPLLTVWTLMLLPAVVGVSGNSRAKDDESQESAPT
jgi:carbohydrate binding protein with CBM4/9 domain